MSTNQSNRPRPLAVDGYVDWMSILVATIYSLGVLLYELLTGTTPFDKQRLSEAAYDEIRRIIREEEPSKPSTKVRTLVKTGGTISGYRGTDTNLLKRHQPQDGLNVGAPRARGHSLL